MLFTEKSHEKREAAHAAARAAIEAASARTVESLQAQIRATQSRCARELAEASTSAEAVRLKLSKVLARETLTALAPHVRSYAEEPSRKAASAIQTILLATDARALAELGEVAHDELLVFAMATVLIRARPAAVSVFGAYGHNTRVVEAMGAVRKALTQSTAAVEAGLSRLEHELGELAVRSNSVDPTAAARFVARCEAGATRRDLFEAQEAFEREQRRAA